MVEFKDGTRSPLYFKNSFMSVYSLTRAVEKKVGISYKEIYEKEHNTYNGVRGPAVIVYDPDVDDLFRKL